MIFKKLYWKLYLRYYVIPHVDHVRYILKHNNRKEAYTRVDAKNRIVATAMLFSQGLSIESVAAYLDCTRERVRQILLKFVRTYQ